MKATSSVVRIVLMFVLGAFLVVPAYATTIRSGSGYGQNIGFSACQSDIAAFDPQNSGTWMNCIGFQQASFSEQIDGTTYPVYLYAFEGEQGGQQTAAIYDVIDLGNISAGSSFSLALNNTNLLFGLFTCGNGSNNFAVDSTQLPGSDNVPCTADTLAGNIFQSGTTFSATGDVSDLTLFTLDGNLAASGMVGTPEPGSIVLVGAGLALLGRKFRRR